MLDSDWAPRWGSGWAPQWGRPLRHVVGEIIYLCKLGNEFSAWAAGQTFSEALRPIACIRSSVVCNGVRYTVTDVERESNWGRTEKMMVPSTVERFGGQCLHHRKDLCAIIFESNSRLQRIGSEAFCWTLLKHITIPSSVEQIGMACFSSCEALSTVVFEANSKLLRISNGVFAKTRIREIIIPSSVEVLERRCFSGCKNLSDIKFESGPKLKEIQEEAFLECEIGKLEIPSTCETLTGGSFCDLLTVTLSKENPFFIIQKPFLMSCDRKAIRYMKRNYSETPLYMTSDMRVVIKNDVEVIGDSCFSGCTSFCEVAFEPGSCLKRIGKYGFRNTLLSDIVIPASVEEIGSECFSDCIYLYEVTFEGKAPSLGIGVFTECRCLECVTVHGGTEESVEQLRRALSWDCRIENIDASGAVSVIRCDSIRGDETDGIPLWMAML
jgi:hypothetical protein